MPPDPAACAPIVETLRGDRAPAGLGRASGEAAEWIRERFADARAADARIEEEPAHGSFAVPVALLAAIGARGRARRAAAGVAAGGGRRSPRPPAIADDVSGGPPLFRRLLPRRRSRCNVIAEAGDPDGEETLVFVAHHDAAQRRARLRPAARAAGSPTRSRTGTRGRRPRRR